MSDDFKLKIPTAEEIESRRFEEYIFELVANEMQSGIRKSGLWVKAISEAGGDEMRAKILYIRFRAQSMIDEVCLAEAAKIKKENEERERKRQIEIASNNLFYAAESGQNLEILNLLNIGANVNVQRCDGITPLYLAASNGHEDTVKILIAHGASPNIVNRSGETAAYAARAARHGKIAEYLDALNL
jgi:hypothetical protein